MTTVLFALISSFLITAFLTPISMIFIKKLGIIDDPKTHKHPAIIHKKPIPRGGSIAMFAGILIAGLIFLPITKMVVALYLASFIALIVGVIDDKMDISPYPRLAVNMITAFIVVSSGVTIPFITNPLGGVVHMDLLRLTFNFFNYNISVSIADAMAFVWIIWVMNMLNWSKGVDGQMPGIVAISAIIIGVLSLRFQPLDQFNLISVNLSFIIAGSALGFLIFNFYPAKIFPGYGATAIYLLLSVVSIMSSAKLATAILVMGVPMTDGVFTIARRIITGRSPFWHDKKHLHHLLLSLGMKQRGVALFYWIISAILGTIALSLSSKAKLFAIFMVAIVVGGSIFFLHLIINKTYVKKNN